MIRESDDYYLFPNMKKELGGNHFATDDDDVMNAVDHFLGAQNGAFYTEGIRLLHDRCIKIKNQRLEVSTTFPGLPVEYSSDNGTTWLKVTESTTITNKDSVLLRTRSSDLSRFSRVITFNPVPHVPVFDQSDIDYMANNMDIHLEILNTTTSNTSNFLAQLSINNTGNRDIRFGNWGIWFCSFTTIKTHFPGHDIRTNHQMTFKLVQGCVYKLEPARGFRPILSGEDRKIKFVIGSWRSLTRSDFFPNWYVSSQGMMSRTIHSAAGEQVDFLGTFNTLNEYRIDGDRYRAYTPEERYTRYSDITDLGEAPIPVIPTPMSVSINRRFRVNLAQHGWKIVTKEQFLPEAKFLQSKTYSIILLQVGACEKDYMKLERMKSLGFPSPGIGERKPIRRVIKLIAADPLILTDSKRSTSIEAYSLAVHPDRETIEITSRARPGIFNAIQTLLGLAMRSRNGGDVPEVNITDAPRFGFRGVLLDVARNFRSKQEVMKILEVMSVYKLNKLHFHLTDSQGWRLEMPGLPELTKVGGQRCHDVTETACLLSTLGSGPDTSTSGSGFYTVSDYKEILRFAAERHIEVIPEIAIPGRSHAAVKSMEARRRILLDKGDSKHADDFLLNDPDIHPGYQAGVFGDDVINPCMDTTFVFVNHVIAQLVAMHEGINPLKTFHFGGHEVAPGTWDNLTLCKPLDVGYHELKERFVKNVSRLAYKHGLNLAAWADGLVGKGTRPFDNGQLLNREVYTNTWNNVLKMGDSSVGRPYALANAGYKVVMSQATHLYFDHPHEPDPNQKGTYWATRFIDTRKVLAFTPDDIYGNADVTLQGEPITNEDLCGADGGRCVKLEHPQSIVGMQGHLWSETIRTDDQLEYMLFPRLLAVAERAWHKAQWESTKDEQDKLSDWFKFANTVGYQELRLLDKYDIAYRIPRPGARLQNNRLFVNTEFPGLKVEVSFDDGLTWKDVDREGISVENVQVLKLATRSPNNVRHSEEITVNLTSLSEASTSLPSLYCVLWCYLAWWFYT
ncbi:beta-hexosaminidase-like [Gigantopelta aegis]|uniref:beta-hexosaminidase-like n=1 Tax=Gigantopelta aegis TaxID=1735272 RepID=UPI001B889919|nr:beta-hexosaminidase-like [Gigantopelta aegis]